MRPSFVRSKTAPHSSSSRTRSGACFAWSSAMRQTLRNLPPRIVSRKWTFQLSRASTLPIAAAMPPSAMTVCALPSRLLETTPVDSFCALHSIAARRPAPPAPMTRTSCSMVWSSDASRVMALPSIEVVDGAHRTQANVDVGDHDPDERGPRELHVALVEPGRLLPRAVAQRVLAARHAVLAAAEQVAQRVTAERVAGDQDDVDRENDAADADAELAIEEERLERVFAEQEDEQQREVERVAMDVLDQQKRALAAVLALARERPDRTARRRRGERAVVRLAV